MLLSIAPYQFWVAEGTRRGSKDEDPVMARILSIRALAFAGILLVAVAASEVVFAVLPQAAAGRTIGQDSRAIEESLAEPG